MFLAVLYFKDIYLNNPVAKDTSLWELSEVFLTMIYEFLTTVSTIYDIIWYTKW